METRKENRLVVVKGSEKICEFHNVDIQESIQDDGRTIKLFLKDKNDKEMQSS